jgi:hypothetical protein
MEAILTPYILSDVWVRSERISIKGHVTKTRISCSLVISSGGSMYGTGLKEEACFLIKSGINRAWIVDTRSEGISKADGGRAQVNQVSRSKAERRRAGGSAVQHMVLSDLQFQMWRGLGRRLAEAPLKDIHATLAQLQLDM